MRAVQYLAFGDPALAVTLVDVPEPAAPGPGEVLLGIEYAPVNFNDLLLIGGRLPKRLIFPRSQETKPTAKFSRSART